MPDLSKLLDFADSFYALHPLDSIVIAGVVLPLAEPPEAGKKLDLDKKKSSGKDGANLVGRAYVKDTIKIRLRLYKDRRIRDSETGDYLDYLALYYRDVHDKLMVGDSKKRDAVSVYHPFLAAEQIRAIVITDRRTPKHEGRGIFIVEITGEDPARFKSQSGTATHKPKNDTELKSNALGNGAAQNPKTQKPSTAQRGKV